MKFIVIMILVFLVLGCQGTYTNKHPDVLNAEVELLEDEGDDSENLVGMAATSSFRYLSCEDTDGQDFRYKGTVDVEYIKRGRIRTTTKTDRCIGSRVQEFYCNDKQLRAVRHTCPEGCQDGACIMADYCGNGVCQFDEDCSTCPRDCLKGECCGDQVRSCKNICTGVQSCQNNYWGPCETTLQFCDSDCDGDLECSYQCPSCGYSINGGP